MVKPITIKLIPKEKDKIYKPLPGYSDLYALMKKLHFNTVNETLEEAEPVIGDLELQLHQAKEALNKNYKEESCLNVMSICLEEFYKKAQSKAGKDKIPFTETSKINDFNNILEESELNIKHKLKKLDINTFSNKNKEFIKDLKENLTLINERKTQLYNNNRNLNDYISKINTLKENLSSSMIDIDSLEVALKNLQISNSNIHTL